MTAGPAEIGRWIFRVLERLHIDARLLNVESMFRKIPNQTLPPHNVSQGSRALRHPVDRIAPFPPSFRQRSREYIRTSKWFEFFLAAWAANRYRLHSISPEPEHRNFSS